MTSAGGDDWPKARGQALAVLREKAEAKDTIPYNKFVRHIKALKNLDYHGDRRLDDLLDEISIEEDKAGRGFISVLVVTASFPAIPSDGFYALAESRHPPGASKQEIYEAERDRVWAAHAKKTTSA